MTFDALQAVWQTADDPAPAIHPETLAALRTEAASFDRTIWWRDLREYAAAVFVMIVFASGWPSAPPLARLGIVSAVAGAGFVCIWMWRAQRQRPPSAPGAATADALRVALERVEIQIRLLRTVAWWYLLPLVVGPLFLTAVGLAESISMLPPIETARNLIGASVALLATVLILAAVGAFFWWIYRINQRAVDKDLIPLRDRLADTLHALTDSDA